MTTDFKALAARAAIDYSAEPEDVPVRGNAIASGDDAVDKACEDGILADLEWNEWAWCVVRCTAKLGSFTGTAYLGACSYKDRADFLAGGYAEQMAAEARDDLIEQLTDAQRLLGSAMQGGDR